jgi:hypothetical protein
LDPDRYYQILSASTPKHQLLRKLRQHALRLCVLWILFQKFEQDGSRFVRRAFNGIDSGEIQVRLIEGRCHSHAFLEAGDGLISPLGAQIKYSEIV